MKDRVLILDDEPTMLNALGRYIGALEYECVALSSPTDALARLQAEAFALLITDLRMPEMYGMDVVRHAKERDRDLAVIVVTGLTDVNSAIDAMRNGADDYVLKPFTFSDIAMAASKALGKRQAVLDARRHNQELETQVHRAAEELERINRELRRTKEYLESLFHSTADGIITVDRSGKIEFANEGAGELLGVSEESLLGRPATEFFVGGSDELRIIRRRLRQDRQVKSYETELRRRDGAVVPVNMSLSLVRYDNGAGATVLAICKDITEQKRLEQELKEMSCKDALTGLYNQRHFYDRLRMEIERARRQKHPLSLLLIDIDQFKTYNDAHGHLEGDRVLQTVGKVILDCTRGHVDTGFRYGGDEFTVILPEADEAQAQHIAERIRRSFESRRFDKLTLSIGLKSYQEGDSASSFIYFADAMMYDAKRSGGNTVYVYRPEVDSKEESDVT